MWNARAVNQKEREPATHHASRDISPVLINLLRDTDASILIYISEQYGLRRIPGLSKANLIDRLLRHLSDAELADLEDGLIAAHYGGLALEELLNRILHSDEMRLGPSRKPRMDEIALEDAALIESSARRWLYTMRGHDVIIDLDRQILACDCQFFTFASQRQALCKHLVTALRLIPEVYAREVLIALLVAREYGGPHPSTWQFESLKAA